MSARDRTSVTDVDVLVAGGGVSGLAAGWWLARRGLSVEVWERDARLGGKIRTRHGSGYQTESAAALLMNSRPEINELLVEAGLRDTVVRRSAPSNRYLLHQGRLVAAPMHLGAVLGSPLWSLRGRLRLALEPFVPRGGGEDETVSQFVTRRLGRELLERALEPYVAGPLASDVDRADARAVLPRLTALERRYGSLALGVIAGRLLHHRSDCIAEILSFQGGMNALIDSLSVGCGIRARPGTVITGLEPDAPGWQVSARSDSGEFTLRARHVVLSVPAYVAAPLVSPLDEGLAALLHGIEYAPLSVVHLGLKESAIRHPLDGTGFLSPRGEGSAINGNLWMSSVFPGRAPPGSALLTSYLGGARMPRAAQWEDERTISVVLSALQPLLGIKGDPELVRIDRHHRALPLYHGAYARRMRAVEESLQRLPGLHLAANYLGGISVRDRIICGHQIAGRVAGDLGKERAERETRAVPSASLSAATT